MLRVVRAAHEAMEAAVERDIPIDAFTTSAALRDVARMRSWPDSESEERADALIERIRSWRRCDHRGQKEAAHRRAPDSLVPRRPAALRRAD
jgi:hypothetical protein